MKILNVAQQGYFRLKKESPCGMLGGLLTLLVFSSLAPRIARGQDLSPDFHHEQNPRLGAKPYLGWSSWSQESHTFTNDAGQTVGGEPWLTEAQIKIQSDALISTGLQRHGFEYINIDAGWALNMAYSLAADSSINYDTYGRPLANPSKFPDGIAATVAYIHHNGQKAGIYWYPGVPMVLAATNPPILHTPYRVDDILVVPYTLGNSFRNSYKIDFSKPGAQEYVNSVVDLFASWGFDLIKLDSVTPNAPAPFQVPLPNCPENNCIDNRPDVKAWHTAIEKSGREILLNLSWSLDHDDVSWWQQYGNSRRIEFDIECHSCTTTITTWPTVLLRFTDLATWESDSGPGKGWNDLDSLEVGNGTNTNDGNTLVSGLTDNERQSMMTLWVIANAPLQIGDDLTQLDAVGLQLLTNDDVIAVDQSGHSGQLVTNGSDGQTPVWAVKNDDCSYTVALFNLNASPAMATINWSELGLQGRAEVFDLWNHSRVGREDDSYSISLPAHGSSLVRVLSLSERGRDEQRPTYAGVDHNCAAPTRE